MFVKVSLLIGQKSRHMYMFTECIVSALFLSKWLFFCHFVKICCENILKSSILFFVKQIANCVLVLFGHIFDQINYNGKYIQCTCNYYFQQVVNIPEKEFLPTV